MDRRYYAATARAMGVPEASIDDAVQDIALAVWLANDDRRAVIKHRAIDAARRYGGDRRWRDRPATVSLAAAATRAAPDLTNVIDRVLDFNAAWGRLTDTARAILQGRKQYATRAAADSARCRARRQLRELAAA